MKRPLLFSLGLWIPTLLCIGLFWVRHLSVQILPTALPVWDRFLAISPGAAAIMVMTLVFAAIWMTVLIFRGDDLPLKIRPLTVGFFWVVLVLLMGLVAFGDVWDFGHLPITAEQKIDVMMREFSLTDPVLVSGFSMFGHLLGKVVFGLGALLLVVLAMIGFGSYPAKLFMGESDLASTKLFVQLALGAAVLILVLLLAALFGQFIPGLLWPILLIGCAIGLFREGKAIFHLLTTPLTLTWARRDVYLGPIFATVFMVVTAASFLHVLRPIPIGWDDIGVYMNVPSLLAQHGSLIGGFGSYNWGLVMSLGFVLWNTPYVAMLLSFLGGICAFWMLYILVREVLPKHEGGIPLLLTTTFAVSPFVIFQLSEDMKVDLGLLFLVGGALLLCIQLWKHENLRTPARFLTIGLMLGVAFGVKMTAILALVMLVVFLLLRFAGGWGASAGILGGVFVLLLGNVFAMGGLEVPVIVRTILLIVTALGSVASVFFARKSVEHFSRLLGWFLTMAFGFLLAFSPWMVFNLRSWCTPQCAPLSVQMLLFSQMQSPRLPVDSAVSTATGASLAESTALKSTLEEQGGTVTEELGRYAGFDTGLMHYMSLPLDATFSVNVGGDYVAMGWVFLALCFALLAYVVARAKFITDAWVVTIYGAIFLWFLTSILVNVQTPAPITHTLTLLSGIGILYAIARGHLLEEQKDLRHAPMILHLTLVTMLYGFLWMYAASGVLWYGIVGFIGVLMGGGYVLSRLREEERPRQYQFFIVAIVLLWILPMLSYKLTTSETTIKTFERSGASVVSMLKPAQAFDSRHFLLFKAGVLSQDAGLKFFNAEYYAASKLLNTETESKIVRIGTLLPYFIASNDTRVASDNQLDQFLATYLPRGDAAYYAGMLYDAGFRYIVFDLGTDSIDKTTKKTLTKKVDIFQNMVNGEAPEATAPMDERGERVFREGGNPRLEEVMRASGFIIWKILP